MDTLEDGLEADRTGGRGGVANRMRLFGGAIRTHIIGSHDRLFDTAREIFLIIKSFNSFK